MRNKFLITLVVRKMQITTKSFYRKLKFAGKYFSAKGSFGFGKKYHFLCHNLVISPNTVGRFSRQRVLGREFAIAFSERERNSTKYPKAFTNIQVGNLGVFNSSLILCFLAFITKNVFLYL